MGITVDNVHNSLLFTGWTEETTWGTSSANNGEKDAIIGNFNIADINSSLVSIRWLKYFGTIEDDRGYSIDTDENGTVYVVGSAGLANYSIINPIFDDQRTSFFIALNASGNLFKFLCNQ